MDERACSITFTGLYDREIGYLAAGYQMRKNDDETSAGYLVKVNPSGDTYWKKTLPVKKIKSVCERSEGGYVVTGRDMKRNLFYMEINNDGSYNANDLKSYKAGDGWNIIESYDPVTKEKEGYLIVGFSDIQAEEQYLYIIQSFNNGTKEHEVMFKENELCSGYTSSVGVSVLQTSDDGYIITGGVGDCPYPAANEDSDVFLLKLTHTLEKDTVWEINPQIFFKDNKTHAEANRIEEVKGGYIITGVVNGNKNSNGFEIYSDVFLLKTDKKGNALPGWPRIYNDPKGFGEVLGAWKEGQSVKTVVDSHGIELGYVIAGYTHITNNNREKDVFLLYTDLNGKSVNGFPQYFGETAVTVNRSRLGGDEGVTG